MRRRYETLRPLLVAVAMLSVVAVPSAAPSATLEEPAPDPAGFWSGAIETPNGRLEIHLALTEGDAGGWEATLDIPAQGLRGFALSNVSVEGGSLAFEMSGVPGHPAFRGEMESAEALSGSFEQGGYSMPFALARVESLPEAPQGPALPPSPVRGEGAAGHWLGVLEAGPMKLRLLVSITERPDGSLDARLDSLDQGVQPPVDSVGYVDGRLDLALPAIQATFSGRINADGSAIEGSWSQGRRLPLTLHRLPDDPR